MKGVFYMLIIINLLVLKANKSLLGLIYMLVLLNLLILLSYYISAEAMDLHVNLHASIDKVLDVWELTTYLYIVRSIENKKLQRKVAYRLRRRFAITQVKNKSQVWWLTEKFGEFLVPLFLIHLIMLIIIIMFTIVFFIYIY